MNTNRAAFGMVLSMVGVLALAGVAQADGFRNPPPGAAGLGRAGAFQAQADDASAISYNPANLVNLDRSEVIVNAALAHTQVEFKNALGMKVDAEDPWQVLPNVFAAWRMEGGWVAGVGLTTPYGQSSEWDRETVFKYQAPFYAKMTLVNINPSAAARLTDKLSAGVGLDVMVSSLTFKQAYPWALSVGQPGLPDGTAKFTADGTGVGANLGLTWEVVSGQRLALTYRSPVRVDYEGDFSARPAPVFLPGAGQTSDFATDITFPDTVGVAYGIQVSESVRVEADVEWLGWSRYDVMDLDVGANQRLLPERQLRNDWDDTFTYSVGADWKVTDEWTLRAGYAFIESPIPDATFSPILPDADRHVIGVGAGWQRGRHAVDLAYTFNIYEDRDIAGRPNPMLNGTYEMQSDLVSVSYRLMF